MLLIVTRFALKLPFLFSFLFSSRIFFTVYVYAFMNKIFHFHCPQSGSNSSLNMKFQRDINLLSFQYLIRRMLEDTEEISNIFD